MRKSDLFHPRVFDDPFWAESYYKRNKQNIIRTAKRLISILDRKFFEGGRILDAGCGFASIAIELAKRYDKAEIVGIDLSTPLLETGKDMIENEGLHKQVQLEEGDVQKINFPDNTFDLVLNTYMFHIVENPVRMLNEIERVCKKNGKIMITDLRRIWLAPVVKKLGTAYTLEEASEIIEESEIRHGLASKGLFWWDYFVL
jgi:ubiquinone/menaquinone biosynthesis C-methylase UbiE